ncbi:hypothetical protein DAEQUDRAFT_356373 [Daedalea quercina L-15889]|uniref:Oxidoreductase AflY n=1 Tax=Daedalea quercina L-15889 TaxID=1314783 RepID=A0A165TRF2_9APHY|nr:hypothetical protein DAEQUDRAFT_356373 [Daedalea quercina L-15889]
MLRGGRVLRTSLSTCQTFIHQNTSQYFRMSSTLPPTIRHGILEVPGATFESQTTVERLLQEDRETDHCFFGKVGLHNHLSHHLLAAYDLGAPSKLLQAIYDQERSGLSPIDLADRSKGLVEKQEVAISSQDWTDYLGQEKYYANYLAFFIDEITQHGAGEVLERYLFSRDANETGALVLLRFIGGAVHPIIQTGYGVEFGSDAMVAQGLAQTAVHKPFVPEIFDFNTPKPQPIKKAPREASSGHRQPYRGQSLLAILREVYDSKVMEPVLPYDPDKPLRVRIQDALQTPGRIDEIRRLAAQWQVDVGRGQAALDEKVEELLWATTLLLAGTGKWGRAPRLDFFLMHMLNMSVFLPSLLSAIPTAESKAALLHAIVPVLLMYLTIRGRPRIDAPLLMSYSATPRPPEKEKDLEPHSTAIGDGHDSAMMNPWPDIIASVLHAPDPHTLKAIRSLYYAAQQYGTTPPGGAIGAFDVESRETHEGMAEVDGTIFVRAAGVVMDTLGWVAHGQPAGKWDFSAHGWDEAWND